MGKLKISIVTPSYNQGQFIEETIKSVIDQHYDNYEYFVMDGGSTDNTTKILEKYNDNITEWVSEKDKGQTDAINKGFRKCTGDIIAWINSDDMYCLDTFKTVADYFEKHPDCYVLQGCIIFTDQDGNLLKRKHPNFSRFLGKNVMFPCMQPSTFFRREVLTKIGYLNNDFHMVMDVEWQSRIAQKYRFHTLEQDFSLFRWHDESKSSQGPESNQYKRCTKEKIEILKRTYPCMSWIFNKNANSFHNAHTLGGKTFRFLRRLFHFELWKLNDKNFDNI